MTQDDIYASEDTTVNGIDAWAAKGIAGRGVLVDYFSWANENGKGYDATQAHAISLDDIKIIIKEKNINLQTGDIFMLRTGESACICIASYSELP